MARLLPKDSLNTALLHILRNADGILAYDHQKYFESIGVPPKNIYPIRVAIDLNVFNPKAEPIDLGESPVLTYAGKLRYKGLYQLVEALSKIDREFTLNLFTEKSEEFEGYVKKKLGDKVKLRGFVPPWRMPSLLTGSDYVINLEHNFPVPGHNPRILREAMA